MIIQWCVKGMHLPSDAEAKTILRDGLLCNWWRKVRVISPADIASKLTLTNLDMHVNHFTMTDPATGKSFKKNTPFISMSAGTVERDTAAKTNYVRRARRTALWFGTQFGRQPTAYLYVCWTVLAPRQAVELGAIAEEIRDLNTYRKYSPYQPEGEVTAKISVPSNQIHSCERWELPPGSKKLALTGIFLNPGFVPPATLSNVRGVI